MQLVIIIIQQQPLLLLQQLLIHMRARFLLKQIHEWLQPPGHYPKFPVVRKVHSWEMPGRALPAYVQRDNGKGSRTVYTVFEGMPGWVLQARVHGSV